MPGKTCRTCTFGTPRYQRGTYPDGDIDGNYVTCSWLALHRGTLPDALAHVGNRVNDIQNAHIERNCPCWSERSK
jgi:hypothetical protein